MVHSVSLLVIIACAIAACRYNMLNLIVVFLGISMLCIDAVLSVRSNLKRYGHWYVPLSTRKQKVVYSLRIIGSLLILVINLFYFTFGQKRYDGVDEARSKMEVVFTDADAGFMYNGTVLCYLPDFGIELVNEGLDAILTAVEIQEVMVSIQEKRDSNEISEEEMKALAVESASKYRTKVKEAEVKLEEIYDCAMAFVLLHMFARILILIERVIASGLMSRITYKIKRKIFKITEEV